MATSSVDRNKNAEIASRNREQAKAQEAALKKKHAEAVSKLQKQHGDKVRELQKVYEDQLDAVRGRGQEALTEKDKKYQSQIDKIKNTQSQQAKNSAQNYESRVRQQQESHEGELKKTEQIHESQMNSLSKNYENDVEKKEELYTKSTEAMRAEQAEALGNQKERLDAQHSKDNNTVRDTQDERINNLTSELQETRETKNAEIRGLKVGNLSDRRELEDDKMSLINEERKTQGLIQDNMRENYNKNLEDLSDKYGQYNRESRSGRAVELINMKNMAEDRNNQQVESLERRIRESKMQNDNDKFLTQKSFNEEKKNYLLASKEALGKAELERSMVYDSANERTSKEIKDITNKNAESFDRQGKYYQGRLGEMGLKYNESIEKQVKGLEIDNKQDKLHAESRQQKITHIMGKEKNELENYYKEVLNEKDRIHKETMTEQRVNMLKERNEAVSKLENRIRETDAKGNEKITQLVNRYEREIGNMKDEHKAEKKRIVEQGNRRLDEAEKSFRFQAESDKVSAKSREEQLKSKFEKNISSMETRHDEEKIRIATSIKK